MFRFGRVPSGKKDRVLYMWHARDTWSQPAKVYLGGYLPMNTRRRTMLIRLTPNPLLQRRHNDHCPTTQRIKPLRFDQEVLAGLVSHSQENRGAGHKGCVTASSTPAFVAASRPGGDKSEPKLRKVSRCWNMFDKLWTAACLGSAPRRPSTQIRLARRRRPDSAGTQQVCLPLLPFAAIANSIWLRKRVKLRADGYSRIVASTRWTTPATVGFPNLWLLITNPLLFFILHHTRHPGPAAGAFAVGQHLELRLEVARQATTTPKPKRP
ncbi:hypothetical protein QBC34DRAFT_163674 [Podospora aff. communis PSN243]|uniref:Uncharacterized protein n=1 Tax=Podospora aff. communis PSN243 TaxID=3040156 RepID=A0AAV9GD63_9PEZI|nr:hypothetical protein QBC34DRAFT_163674 [Podospora aff. communis PSN243]